MRYIGGSWGNWMMKFLSHYPPYLRNCSNLVRCLLTGKGETYHQDELFLTLRVWETDSFLETSWLSHCYTDTTWRGLLRGKSQSSKNIANLSQLWTSLCSNCNEEWLCRSCCLFCCCLIGLGFVLFWRVHLKYSTWLQIVYDLFM